MMVKRPKSKLQYSPPQLSIVGSIAGLTARTPEIAADHVGSTWFDLIYDEPESRNTQVVLH
ncbi:hypothetical protein [Rubellimicrobium roseum]|uniref:Uncharacterized protein n=1 Tax=Rubellimicrobium roseum TaxID=687525 RepID=A0A5C4N9M9_9RHOB|nr:hypothetical protein [Rubellimicrobium roseum]TNC60671.1 hypothetical protein FHG71_21870 [Rubellimicrobium roseum]